MNPNKDALHYHQFPIPGKLQVMPSKPCTTPEELSLAYTPGVGLPVLKIAESPSEAYKYTAKGNLVAVISNGTAILGLGNRGALASKPVMEGKAVLFKRFADIDVFDLEINENDPQKLIAIIKALEPTFGGINLEDIKSPECFEIEKTLIAECSIPVFHDDQHGTAVVAAAGLKNACEIAGHSLRNIKLVINGAGAAGLSCAEMFLSLGVPRDNIFMCDIEGLVTPQSSLPAIKKRFAQNASPASLAETLRGAHAFVGVSAPNVLTAEMVRTMAANPVVFALANPDPEISYQEALASRPDIILATGRSDYPNQINNVLGFPFIFRGALDVRAQKISEGMKKAAAEALAALAKEPLSPQFIQMYGDIPFGRGYFIPKPFDMRVIERVAPAVARAACAEGLALAPIFNWKVYAESLHQRMAPFWAPRGS